MPKADHSGFHSLTPQMQVERAVADLRFGRPVVIRDGSSRMAALALDCTQPSTFDTFAETVQQNHSLYLSGPRASRLRIATKQGIAVPLKGVDFAAASRLAYALHAETPANWSKANDAMDAAATLARTALLLPAMVCADIDADNDRFSACLDIDRATLNQTDTVRQHFEIVARTRVPLRDFGDAEFVVFRGGLAQRDQIAIIVGEPNLNRPVPVRIHSSCITGDLCGSLKCDCGDQLLNGLANLHQAGGGVLLYLDQEGRGTGIGSKMRAYGYQHQGLDTIDADAELGFQSDHRRYEAAVAMLQLLSIPSVILFTNNPSKITALRSGGIRVTAREPVFGAITDENLNYLRTKMLRADHMLDIEQLAVSE